MRELVCWIAEILYYGAAFLAIVAITVIAVYAA